MIEISNFTISLHHEMTRPFLEWIIIKHGSFNFYILVTNSAYSKFVNFSYFFPDNRIRHFMQTETFFINVAKEIGHSPEHLNQDDHPSIKAIKANIPPPEEEVDFKQVSEAKVSKYLGKIGLMAFPQKYYIKLSPSLCHPLRIL